MRWILASSEALQVTYELTKTVTLPLLDDGFFISGTVIYLAGDKKSANAYASHLFFWLCAMVSQKLLGSLLRQNPDSWLAFVTKNQDLSIGGGAS